MAVEVDIQTISAGYNISKINTNFQRIDTALQDAVSRSGGAPNQMDADLDLNGNDLLNVDALYADVFVLDGVPVETGNLQVDPDALVPVGGTDGQVLTKQSAADYDVEWEDVPEGIPAGGTDGQVLTKQSAVDFDADWETPAASGIGGTTGATDNAILRANGVGGSTVQSTGVIVDDSNNVSGVVNLTTSGILSLTKTTGAFTHSDELYDATFTNVVGLTGNDIYAPMFPSIDHYDTLQSVVKIDDGSTIEHATGLAGYVWNDDATTNGVALFGAAIATRDGAAVWGINTLMMDSDTRVAGTATGRLLYNELDFNVMNPGTEVVGLSIGGNSLAQPNSAVGFVVNTLSAALGYKWTTGFYSMDGAATYGLALGPLATSGTNVDSQPILLQYFNGASVKKTLTIHSETNALVIGNDDTDLTLQVTGYINVPTGKGFSINSVLMLSSTSLMLPTGGTVNWNSGNIQIEHSANALTASGTGTSAGLNYFIIEYAATSAEANNLLFRKARGNVGTKTIVASGDSLGKFFGQGYDGANYQSAALLTFEVDGTPGVGDMPGRVVFWTSPDGSASPVERLRIDSRGFTSVAGSFSRGAPVTKGADFTLADTENWVLNNKGSACVVTLPAASSFPGREVHFTNIGGAFALTSASSNVVPKAGGAAGTAILAATDGVWATLVSDGTNWIIMQAGT